MGEMTVMDLLISFTRFSTLPKTEWDLYLKQHPEIMNGDLLDVVCMQAKWREPEFGRRIGEAALYIAKKLSDTQRQETARRLIY